MGVSPLMHAVDSGATQFARILLEHGADVNKGTSPLRIACERGRADIVRVLLDGGADVMRIDGVPPVLKSVLKSALCADDAKRKHSVTPAARL
mmetsp:Transcript_18751/g.57664  ORF Transcript_18751/g.57664 Transcript_18751/m.57664 type:complete len:93 (-) Transcript_18751:115-393(-)